MMTAYDPPLGVEAPASPVSTRSPSPPFSLNSYVELISNALGNSSVISLEVTNPPIPSMPADMSSGEASTPRKSARNSETHMFPNPKAPALSMLTFLSLKSPVTSAREPLTSSRKILKLLTWGFSLRGERKSLSGPLSAAPKRVCPGKRPRAPQIFLPIFILQHPFSSSTAE